jgi:hypothetical protein
MKMAVSRSPQEYLERAGLTEAALPPRPRLNLGDLLISQIPVETFDQASLRNYDGPTAEGHPDAGAAKPWPNQT